MWCLRGVPAHHLGFGLPRIFPLACLAQLVIGTVHRVGVLVGIHRIWCDLLPINPLTTIEVQFARFLRVDPARLLPTEFLLHVRRSLDQCSREIIYVTVERKPLEVLRETILRGLWKFRFNELDRIAELLLFDRG